MFCYVCSDVFLDVFFVCSLMLVFFHYVMCSVICRVICCAMCGVMLGVMFCVMCVMCGVVCMCGIMFYIVSDSGR